jgi:hypothetical protein
MFGTGTGSRVCVDFDGELRREDEAWLHSNESGSRCAACRCSVRSPTGRPDWVNELISKTLSPEKMEINGRFSVKLLLFNKKNYHTIGF